ncbi:MAG: PQQ-binding-like beta-propeller repeat protein [Phycisphaerales bacterium]|nr:PQQ-binding-like beta-propeller repeat protein [Phycisphaerales bacterium]
MPRKSLNRVSCATIIAAIGSSAAGLVAEPGELLWTFELSNISGAFVTVAPDGTIYTTDRDRLWALTPAGTVKWVFDEAGGDGGLTIGGGGQPVDLLPDGRIVVGGGFSIWALDADGVIDWTFSWEGGFYNQIDNGPSVGPDGHIYATAAVNDGFGLGAFSLTTDGDLRWQDSPQPPLTILNASHNQRVRFTDTRMIFGFLATSGPVSVYGYDLDGAQTNYVDYTCVSSPKTDGVARLLLSGQCGVQAIDPESDTILWSVGLGPVNMLPIADGDGIVYSGSWHGPVSAIDASGQVLWTSSNVSLQRTLAVSDEHGVMLYGGESFGQPNWAGAIDIATGEALWELPFDTVDGHNELIWSNEAAFSPDGTVAYFTTRFTSNGAPGRLYAVRIADAPGCTTDLDGSGVVGAPDLASLLANWGECLACAADLDADGSVGPSDLAMLLAAWGRCP